MNKLIHAIEKILTQLDSLHKRSLKETPTRVIVVDPLLESLGWDIRDPDEVELEYPTVDNKAVDYALKINRNPVILVEAKSLNDHLSDVKAITQVVGYATNDGITWCILTNGVKWRVYRSIEECPAPDKLMFEVSLDPRESEGMSAQQLAEQMWRFSRDEMAKGTLDALGEQTFTDGKIRKALNSIMLTPPRQLLNILQREVGDKSLTSSKIKASLGRIWSGTGIAGSQEVFSVADRIDSNDSNRLLTQSQSEISSESREKTTGKTTKKAYREAQHISGNPQEVLELYKAIDRLYLSLKPGAIEKRYTAKTINYLHGKHIYCSVHILQSGLRVWLKLKYNRLENPPSFARDVSNIGHWGVGNLELRITKLADLDVAEPLIRQSLI